LTHHASKLLADQARNSLRHPTARPRVVRHQAQGDGSQDRGAEEEWWRWRARFETTWEQHEKIGQH